MATVSDITTTTLSGLNHIDALLDTGPDWNYLTDASGNARTTIAYTFSIASGVEDAQSAQQNFNGARQAFTLSQQAATRTAFDYISKLTGIQFVETAVGTDAQIHLCNVDLIASNVTGLCSWHSSYSYSGSQLVSYDADAYVYLDNVQFGASNSNLNLGGAGYETLLHELGHALGLKHPFEDDINLPATQDSTLNTLMSYTDVGGPYTAYQQYDIAALQWLYGGDGLRGALGVNSTGGARYLVGTSGADTLTGTAANDKLQGNGGNDMIDGGAGTDTAVFGKARSNYTFNELANGDLQVGSKDGSDGTDILRSIEILQFADGSATRAEVVNADTTAPAAPTLTVAKNANGYANTPTPTVTGAAEAGATVKIFTANNVQVGTATADASGLWSVKLNPLGNGDNYQVYATATDAAGNVSTHSATATFSIDATPPVIPTANLVYTAGSNQATVSGTAEAGTTIELMRILGTTDAVTIARTTVGADGKWSIATSPLPNGGYEVSAVSTDRADNSTSAGSRLSFTVASSANQNGGAGNDTLHAGAGNNAIDGQGGIDTVVYAGTRAGYAVVKEVWGYGVTDRAGDGGHDAVIDVERLQFSDGHLALDVDGNAGEVFRVYQAAFDRPAEAAGLGYWIWRMDNGTSLSTVAQEFMKQTEFYALYGNNPTDAEFVSKLYTNVLHRAAEGAGYDYWLGVLQTHGATRDQVLTFFSESPENQAQVIGSIQNGMDYTPWTA